MSEGRGVKKVIKYDADSCMSLEYPSGLEGEACAACGGSVDHDGYGECEHCNTLYCAEHNTLVKGACASCLGGEGAA